jgi:hypothetical protein
MEQVLGKLRDWLKPWMKGTTPIEIRRAILDDAAHRVVAVGDGERVFPFNHLRVHLLTHDEQERTELEAAVREGWHLKESLAERLRTLPAALPGGSVGLRVVVRFAGLDETADPRFGERRFFVEYLRDERAERAALTVRPGLELTVLKGTATQRVYDLDAERVHLGRLHEVTDPHGRVRRRNDVVFLDEGEVSKTVSREHARIQWDEASAGFWLRCEQNGAATHIFRSGRNIEVSSHDRRGVRLQAGDEILLGKACVKVGFRPRT